MRVIFIADVHHAFSQVERLLDQTEADLYLVTGDLASRAFFKYATAWRFMELQQAMAGFRTRENLEGTLDRAAQRIVKSGKGHSQFSQAEDQNRKIPRLTKKTRRGYALKIYD